MSVETEKQYRAREATRSGVETMPPRDRRLSQEVAGKWQKWITRRDRLLLAATVTLVVAAVCWLAALPGPLPLLIAGIALAGAALACDRAAFDILDRGRPRR